MKHILLLFILLFPSIVWADANSNSSQLLIQEQNGTNAGRYRVLKVSNGTTTNNGDGSISVTTGSGGGGGGSTTPGGSQYDVQFYDVSGTVNFFNGNNGFVYNGTNVGIGSVNPTQKLDVTGTVKATAFIGNGSGLTNLPAQISGLTNNFITKATSGTTIGNSQAFDDGTNIGIGTSTSLRNKLDVNGNMDARGNIIIKTPTFNTTDGSFQGVGSVPTLFPASQTGAINDIETILPYFQGQLMYTVNGTGSGMALFNGSYLFGYALTVTGITVAPTHNSTYNNGVCTQTIYATNLTAGAGTISVHSNCALSATGTTNKTSGTGDASFSWTASNTLPSYAAGMSIPGGVDEFGDPNHPELNSENTNPVWSIGYGQVGRVTSSDTGVHLQCGIYAPFSSGCSWFSDIMNDDGTVRDPVGSQTSDVQGLVPLEFDGGGVMWIFNPNSYNPRVMGISASSGTGLDSGGNFGGYFFDAVDTYNGKLAMRFPHHIAHVHMPGSKSYIFSGITGVTTAPAPNVNQQPEYSISGGTGEHYDWIKNNLSGGAGTITFESRSTPASSGTLTKIVVAGIPIGLGDSTIAYTSVAVESSYQDTMYLDEFNGNVGIGTMVPKQTLDVVGTMRITGNIGIGSATPGQSLDVIGTVKATNFIGSGSGLTGLPSGSPGTPLNSVQYNNSSAFAGSANFTFNGTNVGIGTSVPTGILTIGNISTNGREFYLTGSNASANLDLIRGDPESVDNGYYVDENFNNGNVLYNGMTVSIDGGGLLQVGTNTTLSPVTLDGGVSIGPFSGSVDRAAPANGLIVSGNVGIGTWLPTGIFEVGNRRLNVLNTGNVGIASINPGMTLDVVGSVRATAFFGNGSGLTGLPSGSSQWTGTGTGPLTYSSGNVGIGSINPQSLLDVAGTATFSGSGNAYFSGNLGIGSVNPTAALDIAGSGNASFTGNVGIGSASPGSPLDVQGKIRISQLGGSLSIITGTNSCKGQATLTSGTATVSTTCTPSTSEGIFLTDATTGTLTNVGSQTVGTVTGGTSFVINSTNVLDSSKVNWVIFTSN